MTPYCEAEREWKIRVFDSQGVSGGFVNFAQWVHEYGRDSLRHHAERTWRGRPRNGHFETLVHYHSDFYFILIHMKGNELSEEDYGRDVTLQQAAQWLMEEGYDLPEELEKYSTASGRNDSTMIPLTDRQQEVWAILKGEQLTAKEIAAELDSTPEAVRQLIKGIRRTGRTVKSQGVSGYYRPDAPPDKDCESH